MHGLRLLEIRRMCGVKIGRVGIGHGDAEFTGQGRRRRRLLVILVRNSCGVMPTAFNWRSNASGDRRGPANWSVAVRLGLADDLVGSVDFCNKS